MNKKDLNWLMTKQDNKIKNFGMVGMGYVVELWNDKEDELTALKEREKKLVEVVKFYALVLNWRVEYRASEWSVIKQNDCDRDIPSRNIVGGKRAREVLKELGVIV